MITRKYTYLAGEEEFKNVEIPIYNTKNIGLVYAKNKKVLNNLGWFNKIENNFGETIEEKFKEDIQNDNEGKVKINIGLINIYLYFCQREPLKISPSLSISGDFIPPTYKTFSNIKADIDLSVGYLQKAVQLATETIDIAEGIYLYNTIRLFEYIFSVFEYYKVDNDNVPIDLDSFYVFNDQLDNDEFWNELTRQIKIKYDIK